MRIRLNIQLFACIYICSISALHSQDSTLHVLDEAVIKSNRYESDQTGFKSVKPDSAIKNNFNGFSLADMFAYSNHFFVKSYGGNGIASSSIRGSSASQSTINWNGFTINSPMLGQSDLSVLPSFFFDDVTTVYGGNSGIAGSGAIGGTVYLKNKISFENALEIRAFSNYSSFGVLRNGFAINRSFKRFTNSTKVFLNSGNNNFLYADTINGVYTKKRLSHTNFLQYGLLQENYFLINKHQKAGIHLWVQNSEKQLPNPMSDIQSKKSQQDASARITADWQLTKEKYTLFARSAVMHDLLNYTDSSSAIYSKSQSIVSLTELETKYRLHKQHILDGGIQYSISIAKAKNYAENSKLGKYSAFGSWKFENKKKWFESNLGLRQEIMINGSKPFTWNMGFVVKPFSFAGIHANAGKVFRFPTLNDLYWNPGGNPGLKPEEGYTEEIGAALSGKLNNWDLFFDLTCFNREIKNWISWLPAGSGIWSPVNIMQVWSRGCETQSAITYKKNKFLISEKLNTNYILSTYMKQVNENDESVGRQLIYTPMYSGSSVSTVSYKNFSLLYVISYNGYRYLSSDNYQYLSPYWLHNIAVNYRYTCKKTEWNIMLGADNLLNKNYMVVAANPMPLRYLKTGITLKFNK